jgi:hypothetical protein
MYYGKEVSPLDRLVHIRCVSEKRREFAVVEAAALQ